LCKVIVSKKLRQILQQAVVLEYLTGSGESEVVNKAREFGPCPRKPGIRTESGEPRDSINPWIMRIKFPGMNIKDERGPFIFQQS